MIFQAARDFCFNSAIAALGVVIVEEVVYPLYRPSTIIGVYEKEFLLSAAIAFALGFLVYFRWQYRAALWVWVLGAFTYIGRSAFDVLQAPLTTGDAAILGMVSVRAVFYSLGAVCCLLTMRIAGKSRE